MIRDNSLDAIEVRGRRGKFPRRKKGKLFAIILIIYGTLNILERKKKVFSKKRIILPLSLSLSVSSATEAFYSLI